MTNKIYKIKIPEALLTLIICAGFLALNARHCHAQAVGDVAKPSGRYINLDNDMKYYQILRHETDKDYMSYAQAIREKIKQRIKSRYKNYFKEGNINLFFIVKADGSLTEFTIDNKNSTPDARLAVIAVSGLKDSSPFPPFPKELTAGELPFSVMISFKEK